MITFGYASKDSETGEDIGATVAMGLTAQNVMRIMADEPIVFDIPEGMPPTTQIVIFHATEEALKEYAEELGIDKDALLMQLGELGEDEERIWPGDERSDDD